MRSDLKKLDETEADCRYLAGCLARSSAAVAIATRALKDAEYQEAVDLEKLHTRIGELRKLATTPAPLDKSDAEETKR